MFDSVTVSGRNIPMEMYCSDSAMTSMTLHIMKTAGGDYILRFEYDSGKFREDTVRRMRDVYLRIVSGLCSEDSLKDIVLVSDETVDEMDSYNSDEKEVPAADLVSRAYSVMFWLNTPVRTLPYSQASITAETIRASTEPFQCW